MQPSTSDMQTLMGREGRGKPLNNRVIIKKFQKSKI
jgi:hypothetical protein